MLRDGQLRLFNMIVEAAEEKTGKPLAASDRTLIENLCLNIQGIMDKFYDLVYVIEKIKKCKDDKEKDKLSAEGLRLLTIIMLDVMSRHESAKALYNYQTNFNKQHLKPEATCPH